mgnify:FL=1
MNISCSISLFINLEEEKLAKDYWLDRENRKKFFLEMAAEMGFDPMKPQNWAHVSGVHILAHNVL